MKNYKKLLAMCILSINLLGQETDVEYYNAQLDSITKEESIRFEESIIKEPRGDWNRLGKQTVSAGILAASTAGLLFILPEEFTNWDREDIKDINGKWKRNVRRGPVWDHDDAILNYVAHPYVGSTYYVAARKSDFNEFDSFLYSFAMSTFFWEYGVEAFAETPSIQDLIVTPVFGAFLGEYLYKQEKKILENDGKIGDSRFWGRTALVLIDPIGTLSNLIGFKDDQVEGNWTFAQSKTTVDGSVELDPVVGLSFTYSF